MNEANIKPILSFLIVILLCNFVQTSEPSSSPREQFEYHSQFCNITGPCLSCPENVKSEEYCVNGMYQEIRCATENGSNITTTHKSCSVLEESAQSNTFFLFEGLTLGVLLCALYIVIRRKQKLAQDQYEKIARQAGSPPPKNHTAPTNSSVV